MKLSVIIPVYNAEKFLKDCINSVLNQDFDDFELLLINDGSTDNSGRICDLYAVADKRVKVFHKANGGVSSARNVGLENAIGKWITFIDSDDIIQKRYFNALEIQDNADWIYLKIKRQIPLWHSNLMNFENQEYSLIQFTNLYSLYPHFPEACGKFFKTKIIRENNLRFNKDLKFGEDSLFNLQYLKFCKTIFTTNISEYIYNNDEGTLSKLDYDIKNDINLFTLVELELESFNYPKAFHEQSIKIPLTRYLRIIYLDKSIKIADRKILLKRNIKKYFKLCKEIYSHPKINFLLVFSHYSKFYVTLDQVLSILSKKHTGK